MTHYRVLQNHKVSYLLTFFLLALVFFLALILPLRTKAQEPYPPPAPPTEPFPPPPVPCDETRSDEFHSLRPYQASPCNTDASDLALFCGNDFILIDTLVISKIYTDGTMIPSLDWEYQFEGTPIDPTVEQPPDIPIACTYCSNGQCLSRTPPCIPYPDLGCGSSADCAATTCIDNGDGTETCTFVVDRVKDIVIDLEGAELPIMGYTEPSIGNQSDPYRVINSRYQDETVTDAQKVNEYVSWYMNGVIGRAEYDPPDTTTEEGIRKVVDFSGPMKRLLSWESQIVRRIEEVEKARTSLSPACDPTADPSDPDCIRHNQIIGCFNLLGQPTHCYPDRAGVSKLRLSYWYTIGRYPPLRRAYNSFDAFWRAYEDWRNDTYWRLFTYIPFSSTEDRIGQVEISSYTIQPPLSSDVVILASAILNQIPADLFFSHMQESVELADLLQRVYSFQEADLNAEPEDTVAPLNRYCDIVEVRSNPGDNLFATQFSATITYTAQVSCTYTLPGEGRVCIASGGTCQSLPYEDYSCGTYYAQVDCPTGQFCGVGCSPAPPTCLSSGTLCYDPLNPFPVLGTCCPTLDCVIGVTGDGFCEDNFTITPFNFTEDCTNQVPIAFQTITKTPLADQVWKKLVAGPTSVFRRLFPQIEDEEGRPIRRLWDIPAVTGVIFSSLTGDTIIAGNPSTGRPGSQAELYFPHIGGVHEYFLNCIQKTLRPQGFGQGCVTGPPPLSHITGEGSCATPPPPPGAVSGAGPCEIPSSGFCSPSYLQSVTRAYDGVGWSACRARQAAIICNRESGGNPSAINCGCLLGTSVDYSVGLFQINLLAHSTPDLRCYDAFEYTWTPPSCTILDQGVVDECASYYFDPENNVIKAYQMSLGGTRWDPWSATAVCADEIAAQCP